MSKRILSAALALALSLSLAVPAFAEEEGPFSDVPTTHWAIEAIRQAEDPEAGRSYFAPDDQLTAAQFATIVTKAFYWRTINDVKQEEGWSALYRKTAEQAGLMEGVGVEDWDAPMTRYQMAVMLYNLPCPTRRRWRRWRLLTGTRSRRNFRRPCPPPTLWACCPVWRTAPSPGTRP